MVSFGRVPFGRFQVLKKGVVSNCWSRCFSGSCCFERRNTNNPLPKQPPASTPVKSAPTLFRNTPSTAGNSVTSSERPSPEPILKKETSPAVLGGREFWKRSGRLRCLEL